MPFAESIDDDILDHYTGKATWTAPTATWIGLSSTTPTKTGTNVTEPSGGAYARQQVTSANWASAASSATSNTPEIAYPTATADWLSAANLTHMVIYTAETAGTFIGSKALTVAKPVTNGDTAKFAAGDIDLVMGGTA